MQAQIENGVVVRIAAAATGGGTWVPAGAGCVLGAGWTGSEFTPPPRYPAAVRVEAVRAECEAMIKGVIDDNTRANLFAAAIAGALAPAERAVFDAGQAWVREMVLECRRALAEARDPVWPEMPEGLVALAEEY